jgi:hypothetical protein
VHLRGAQKLYSVVSLPFGVSLKIVPPPLPPPNSVVPYKLPSVRAKNNPPVLSKNDPGGP